MDWTLNVDGLVVIGGLEMAGMQPNMKFFMLKSNFKKASSCGLPEQYQNGILIQAGLIGGLKGYVLTDFTLKEFCGRIMRLGPAIMICTKLREHLETLSQGLDRQKN